MCRNKEFASACAAHVRGEHEEEVRGRIVKLRYCQRKEYKRKSGEKRRKLCRKG